MYNASPRSFPFLVLALAGRIQYVSIVIEIKALLGLLQLRYTQGWDLEHRFRRDAAGSEAFALFPEHVQRLPSILPVPLGTGPTRGRKKMTKHRRNAIVHGLDTTYEALAASLLAAGAVGRGDARRAKSADHLAVDNTCP